MVAALQRITAAFSEWSGSWRSRNAVTAKHGSSRDMVGEYEADYTEPSEDELATADEDSEALLARSRVVSSKRL